MRILCFIPAYGRRAITGTCYQALQNRIEAAPAGYTVQVLCIVSNQADEALAKEYGFKTVQVANKPLGRKFNTGLEYVFRNFQFDYLLQLNSDNLLHVNFWQAFEPYLTGRLPFFGCNHIAFYDTATGKALRYLYGTGCGIRFIRYDILLGAFNQVKVNNPADRVGNGWTVPAGETWVSYPQYRPNLYGPVTAKRFRLWNPEKNKGLDFDSEATIRQAWPGAQYRQRFPAGTTPLVVDVKSDENIHGFDEFDGDDMAQPFSIEEAVRAFPELKLIADKQKNEVSRVQIPPLSG